MRTWNVAKGWRRASEKGEAGVNLKRKKKCRTLAEKPEQQTPRKGKTDFS